MMCWFEALPDAVACSILSRLGSAQAVARCAAVCRRWRLLCGCVEALSFASFALFQKRVGGGGASCLERMVSQMLLRSSGLRELSVSYHPVEWPWIPHDHFSEAQVCTWLEHVQTSLVKLVLVDPNREQPQPQRLLSLSQCSRLRCLHLCYGVIPAIPPAFRRMDALRSCLLELITLSDAALESLVALCPSLQQLKLNSCTGLRSPVVASPTLLSLDFAYDMDVCDASVSRVILDAPKLRSLRLSYVEELVSARGGVQEALAELGLLCHVRPGGIAHLPALTRLHLHGDDWQLSSLLHLLGLAANLTHLHLDAAILDKGPVPLHRMFPHLPSPLKHLFLGADMFECLQAGAVGKRVAAIWLPRLEQVTLAVRSGGEGCIAVVSSLLGCSASLRSLRLNAIQLAKGAANLTLFTDVLRLQREYPKVALTLDCPYTLQ